MTDISGPRIGDQQRTRALERLSQAMADGRLTADEFDQRTTSAMTARTDDELARLTADLDRSPRAPASVTLTWQDGAKAAGFLLAALLVCVLIGEEALFEPFTVAMMWIGMVACGAVGFALGRHGRDRPTE